MKKIFALLLVAVMCFSLVACAQTETSGNKTKENTVEITLDNWQDYFEIKQYINSYITTNDFDEPTGYSYSFVTLFTIKEDLTEDVVSCDVAIEYDADCSPQNIVFNASDLTFEITGEYEGDVPEDYRDSSNFTRGATAKLGPVIFYQYYLKDGKVEGGQIDKPYSVVISGFDNDGDMAKILTDNNEEWKETNEGHINKYTENVSITRIEGTLVINQ